MKFWLLIAVRLLLIIALLILFALTSRMHIFLAIPVAVLGYVAFAFLTIWTENLED